MTWPRPRARALDNCDFRAAREAVERLAPGDVRTQLAEAYRAALARERGTNDLFERADAAYRDKRYDEALSLLEQARANTRWRRLSREDRGIHRNDTGGMGQRRVRGGGRGDRCVRIRARQAASGKRCAGGASGARNNRLAVCRRLRAREADERSVEPGQRGDAQREPVGGARAPHRGRGKHPVWRLSRADSGGACTDRPARNR